MKKLLLLLALAAPSVHAADQPHAVLNINRLYGGVIELCVTNAKTGIIYQVLRSDDAHAPLDKWQHMAYITGPDVWYCYPNRPYRQRDFFMLYQYYSPYKLSNAEALGKRKETK